MQNLLEYSNGFLINMGNDNKRANWIDGKCQSGTGYMKTTKKTPAEKRIKLALETSNIMKIQMTF